MKDCKHKSFEKCCMVCWVKIGNGFKVNGAPTRGDEGTEKHRKDCIAMAAAIGENLIEIYKTSYNKKENYGEDNISNI